MKTWNRERKRTRDRLLDYEFTIVPPHPHSGGIPFIFPIETDSSIPILDAASTVLPIIYPWENVQLDFLEDEIFGYQLVKYNYFYYFLQILEKIFLILIFCCN